MLPGRAVLKFWVPQKSLFSVQPFISPIVYLLDWRIFINDFLLKLSQIIQYLQKYRLAH